MTANSSRGSGRAVGVGAALALALIGCSKSADGTPPASEWQPAPAALPSGTGPHAAATGSAPRGPIGTDVSKLGLPAPEAGRPLDPTHHVRGVIQAAPGVADKLREGGAVFVVVKRDDHGKPAGPPLAVQRLSWKPGMTFELSERQAMIAGTQLTGDVIVTARYDQDGDALTKQAGDVSGQARVKVPADAIALALDTVLP
jgi:hypothetical protein